MKKYKICIDAGHGGKDPGAVYKERLEKDDTLKIANRLGEVLEANGFDIYYTRTEDRYDSPMEKSRIGNSGDGDYFVSVHRNASLSQNVSGVEVYLYDKLGKKNDIAEEITKNLEYVGFINRGVKVNKRLTVLNETKMPALVVELGFIGSEEDCRILDRKFYGVVNAAAKGIMTALDMEFKSITRLKLEKRENNRR